MEIETRAWALTGRLVVWLALVALFVALLAACKTAETRRDEEPAAGGSEVDEDRIAPAAMDGLALCKARCTGGEGDPTCAVPAAVTDQQVSATTYYQDTDSGDDPFKEGCLYSYSDAACSLDEEPFGPDFCCSGTLFEHVAADCTTKAGFKAYDCAAHCKATVGSPSGRCVNVPDPCRGYPPPAPGPLPFRRDGGKCVCN